MSTPAAAALLNLLGFITGSALYAMLLVMVLNQARAESTIGTDGRPDRLPLLTGLLGLAWNFGELATILLRGRFPLVLLLVDATSFTALGFLPAVMVHSVLRTREDLRDRPAALWMIVTAYALSVTAGLLHFHQAFVFKFAPSHWALHILTGGFIALIVALLAHTRRRPEHLGQYLPSGHSLWTRAGWVLALAVFAVSALHLSHHEGKEFSWWIELIGHHASLPLVLTILYQDYKFALADIFLKRALSLLLLVALAFGLYLAFVTPLIGRRGAHGAYDQVVVGLVLGLWITTALVYPVIRRAVNRFVDAIVLRRADYDEVRAVIAQRIAAHESPEDILDEACEKLSEVLTARKVSWIITNDSDLGRKTVAAVLVPTTEPPQYRLLISELSGGRRLLSDDLALLESAAVMTARRIDAVRITHERYARDLNEREIRRLATQAELRALRAQINPHFLFNALTTIGYLIQTTPELALQTLMRLTALLRGVLRRLDGPDGEFSSLGEEIELIESYLEIERARFEDRLRVTIDVPASLRSIRIPSLLIQPLVENAIKHGISPQRAGGEVIISAQLARGYADKVLHDDRLQIAVRDTGAGASQFVMGHGCERGVGLSNVEERIWRHFGERAALSIRSAPGEGTTVMLEVPIVSSGASDNSILARRVQV
jgi:signal transduction histidine kinase